MKVKLTKSLLKTFNTPDTLLVISSFPKIDQEVAKENAVSWYTHLLFSHYPKDKHVVILSEQSDTYSNTPYLIKKNILVIPTFKKKSATLFRQLSKRISTFDQISNIHLQFEFSIYGSIAVSMSFVPFLQLLKLRGKYLTITLHQVVSDINQMAEHVGLTKNSLNTKTINTGLYLFYKSLLRICDKVIVHDELLKLKLSEFGDETKIEVIPLGVKPVKAISHKERILNRKKLNISAQDQVVLAYGYKSWYKGTDWVVNAMNQLNKKAKKNNYRLLLAGDYSPTQYNNPKYQLFIQKLEKLVKKSDQIISTGFVPEKDVRSIFAAADVVVFPYRARMSASGALSLAWQYRKPFLLSTYCAENIDATDTTKLLAESGLRKDELTFSLKADQFTAKLGNILKSKQTQNQMKHLGFKITNERSWTKVSLAYSKILTGSQKPTRYFLPEFTTVRESTRRLFTVATRPLFSFAQSYR